MPFKCSLASQCCGGTFIFTEPAAPAVIAPFEWNEWMKMIKSMDPLEAMLEKMGLLKLESKKDVALAVAVRILLLPVTITNRNIASLIRKD